MSSDRVPPLNWIRTFERAASLQSFKLAAMQLHVTPGAISQQIKNLEKELGQTLFKRAQQPIALTPAGEALLERIQGPIREIEDALIDVRTRRDEEPVRVWGSRFFMRLWLLPRLHLFQEKHSGIKLDLQTAPPLASVPSNCDVAVRVGSDPNPELHREQLLRRVAVPVCSHSYLERAGRVQNLDDYTNHSLLRGSLHEDEWMMWLSANGRPDIQPKKVTQLSSSDLVHSAALEGVGIALGRLGFIEKELETGHLVKLVGQPADVGSPFYLHYHKDKADNPNIRKFTTWLRNCVAEQTVNFPPSERALRPVV